MPSWISEGSVRKYHRAVAELTKNKQPVTEEAVKELYVKWGGLVVGGSEPAAEEVIDLEDMKVAELRALAASRDIDVEGLTKAEIVEKLK